MRAAGWLISIVALCLACAGGRATAPAGTDSGAAGVDEPPAPLAPRTGNEFVLPYGARTVYAYADPDLAGEVERLFLLLEDLRAESVEIGDNTELPIGWTTLTFAVEGEAGERLVVREPDYDDDPEGQTRADISVSLAILARQRAVLEQAGVAGEAIDFDEHVLTIAGALDIDEVLLLRVQSPGGRLSGWRLAPTAGIAEADELESLPVHVILQRRPALLDAMLLPSGYMAYFSGDRLTTILDEHDAVVWDWRGGATDRIPPERLAPDPDGSSPSPRLPRGPLLPPLGE